MSLLRYMIELFLDGNENLDSSFSCRIGKTLFAPDGNSLFAVHNWMRHRQ